MSAHTTAWLEANATPEHELRERLHEALTVLHEALPILECDDWRDVSDFAENMKSERDGAKETGDEELVEAQATIESLKEQIEALKTPVQKDLLAVREHYAKHGLRVIEGDGETDQRSADELYREATEIDESDPKKGEDLYLRVLALDPTFANARCNLGNIYFRRGDVVKAEEAYRRAIKDNPRCAEAHYNLGYLFLDRGQPKEATVHFERSVDIDPRFADAWFNFAMALEQINARERARACWQKYLDIEPRGTWADIARKHLEPEKPKRIRRKRTS